MSYTVQAQSTKKLLLELPQQKVANSLYNKLSLIDARPDTEGMGIVQTGMGNKPAKVIAKKPLAAQLDNIMAGLTDQTSQSGELLLQLRQLNFAEITSTFKDRGFFNLQAQLFAKNTNGYQKIDVIDTLIIITAGDVTRSLLKKGSETLISFIAKNLVKSANGSLVAHRDIAKVDSIEKSKIKLYTTDKYTDGLYYSYKSFADQTPDAKFMLDGKKVKKSNVKLVDDKGVAKKIPATDTVYALVHNGKPYIATEFEYYPLEKAGTDFTFVGKISATANTTDVIAGAVLFGVAGGLLAAASNSAPTYEVKIYHLNGYFVKLREYITDSGY
ncbi:MAG: hypothetical protein V4619_13250 [Bacteroidota bacterium]